MAIKTGIGIGAAQVYDTGGLVNNFAKLLQKQQQDEAKFQTEIADLISKVDTKGVRDQDKAEIAKMYSATKDLYAQAAATKNFQEKALLKSKISKAVGDINEYAARSAEFSKRFNELNNRIAQDSWAYDPKVLDKLRDISGKSLISMGADAQLDPFQYQKMPNDRSRDAVFSAIKRQGDDFAKSKFVREGNREREIKTTPDEFIVGVISDKLLSNPEYRTTAIYNFKQLNPDAPVNMDAIIANEAAMYKDQFGTQYIGSASRIPKEGEKEVEDKLTYRQQLIKRLINKDQSAKEDLLANLPANAKVDYRTSKSIPGKSQGGVGVIRITIPESSSPTGMEIVEDISLGSGSVAQKLNYIINQYGTEKVSPSKLGIVGGRQVGKTFSPDSPKPKKESGKITVVLDGQEGEIDASQWSAFQKKYPKAKRK